MRPGSRAAGWRPRAGDAVLARIRGVTRTATVEIVAGGHPLGVFTRGEEHVALLGIDLDAPAGPVRWQVKVTSDGRVIEPSKIRKNSKVQVHYIKEGDDMLVDKVIVTKAHY